jgi:hypothetical protein
MLQIYGVASLLTRCTSGAAAGRLLRASCIAVKLYQDFIKWITARKPPHEKLYFKLANPDLVNYVQAFWQEN